ncbi:hypothetical protein ATW55_06965 [Ferroacidibacillus organovorans]|uniref:Fatty acid biosynthesis transcriptional regulator n=2 Tax=Ferroacidibacillus organovorans TaxID=1765683 RepID=A0A101XQH8_9BACL|nr:hypothetical protein ATW55_06965 [Ferroacidibacillus organovorans]
MSIRGDPCMSTQKKTRHERLLHIIESDPLLKDEELAKRLGVSVQTIRLDRSQLGIPEVRERMRRAATTHFESPRTLEVDEVVGEIIDLEIGRHGLSIFEVGAEHALSRSRIVRGHHLFAQANTLAVAIVDAKQALTARVTVRFLRAAHVGDRLIAKATVTGERAGFVRVAVRTRVGSQEILQADFLVTQGLREAERGSEIRETRH